MKNLDPVKMLVTMVDDRSQMQGFFCYHRRLIPLLMFGYLVGPRTGYSQQPEPVGITRAVAWDLTRHPDSWF